MWAFLSPNTCSKILSASRSWSTNAIRSTFKSKIRKKERKRMRRLELTSIQLICSSVVNSWRKFTLMMIKAWAELAFNSKTPSLVSLILLQKIYNRTIKCLSHQPLIFRTDCLSIIQISSRLRRNKLRTRNELQRVPLSIHRTWDTKASSKMSSPCSASSNSPAVAKNPCQSRSLEATSMERQAWVEIIPSRHPKVSPKCKQNIQGRTYIEQAASMP